LAGASAGQQTSPLVQQSAVVAHAPPVAAPEQQVSPLLQSPEQQSPAPSQWLPFDWQPPPLLELDELLLLELEELPLEVLPLEVLPLEVLPLEVEVEHLPGTQLPAEQSATLPGSPEAQLALAPHWTSPAGYTQSPVTAAHAVAPQGKAVLQAVAQQVPRQRPEPHWASRVQASPAGGSLFPPDEPPELVPPVVVCGAVSGPVSRSPLQWPPAQLWPDGQSASTWHANCAPVAGARLAQEAAAMIPTAATAVRSASDQLMPYRISPGPPPEHEELSAPPVGKPDAAPQ
jgi:hypothetical protein